jgi:hypothetical protein
MTTGELRDAVLNLHDLGEALTEDITFAMELRGPADARSEPKRMYVRAVFALVDGMTAAYKRLALAEHARGSVPFSAAEVAFLRGVTYELTESGEAVERRKHLGFSSRVKLSLRAFARALCGRDDVDFSTEGWQALYKGSRIRNRLMHPCTPRDLELSAEDLDVVAKGLYWFWAEFGRITTRVEQK